MKRVMLFFLLGVFVPMMAYSNSAIVEHPVYQPTGKIASYEEIINPILRMSESQMLNIIPRMNGLHFCGCPNCKGGSQENQMEWNGISNPNHVHCKYCKMVYPNDKYPEKREMKAFNRKGEIEIWRFYEDGKKQQYFFSARARYVAKQYMAEGAYGFAAAYALTGKKEYARRATLILHQFAQVYPKWNVMIDRQFPHAKGPLSNAKEPYPHWGGIWNRWHVYDIPIQLIQAYDLIYKSKELEKLSRETHMDVQKSIEDMFHSAVLFVLTYRDLYGNMSPYVYRGLIVSGRVLGEPKYIHEALKRMNAFYGKRFFFDGMWYEGSLSYHGQVVNALDLCAREIKGYSDPVGHQPAPGENRLENVDLEENAGIIKRSKKVSSELTFPDGHMVPVHDTWPEKLHLTGRAHGSKLLTDYGHVRLNSESEPDDILQAHLHFSGGYGHQHADGLQLILFAKGQELLSDIGYTHTAWSFWTKGTPSHNTVVVNEQLQKSAGYSGNIQLYSPAEGPIQAVEVMQLNAYPSVVNDYRRRLIVIRASAKDAYVVDLFHVFGGNRHEYFLHGSSWYQQKVQSDLNFSRIPGTLLGKNVKYKLPISEADTGNVSNGKLLDYAMFSNLRESFSDQMFSVTWQFTEDSKAHLRSTFIGQPGSRAILADTPQIRPAKEDNGRLGDFKRPSLVVQRIGAEPLESAFIAIHEPYVNQPFLQEIKHLFPLNRSGDENPDVLSLKHHQGTDYIVSSNMLGGKRVSLKEYALDAKARLAIIRRDKGKILFAFMHDGEELSADNISIKCNPSPSGRILAVNRDTGKNIYNLLIDTKLPLDISLKGYSIIITHPDNTTHGYLIDRIASHSKGTLVYLEDDPGFDLQNGKTRFLFFPQRELTGMNNYRINNSIIIKRKDDGTYGVDANCSVRITFQRK